MYATILIKTKNKFLPSRLSNVNMHICICIRLNIFTSVHYPLKYNMK